MQMPDLTNPRELLRITSAALDKARRNRPRLSSLWSDLHRLTELVGAWARREYTVVPWRTIATAVGALIYFINPMDAMADVLPGVGYLDDGAVLAFVVSSLQGDIERFQEWKREQKRLKGAAAKSRTVQPDAVPRRSRSSAGSS